MRISNQVIRSGAEVHEGAVDYFDFALKGSFQVMQTSFVVKRGDAFRTTCYYNTTGNTYFGLSSGQEMCNMFLLYYPVQAIPEGRCAYSKKRDSECAAAYNWTLTNEIGLGRMFGVPKTSHLTVATSKSQPLLSLVLTVAVLAVFAYLVIYHINKKKSVQQYNHISQEEEEPHPIQELS